MPALCVGEADCDRLRGCEADGGRERDGTGEVEVRCGGGGVSARGSSWLLARQWEGSIALASSRRFCKADGSCNSRTCDGGAAAAAQAPRRRGGARVLLERGARYAGAGAGRGSGRVARLREHYLKLRDALARRARLDVCRDGIEALRHQAQALLLRSGRAAG